MQNTKYSQSVQIQNTKVYLNILRINTYFKYMSFKYCPHLRIIHAHITKLHVKLHL